MSCLEWLFKVFIVWLCVDLVVIVVGLFLKIVIKPRYPNWWRQVMADYDPWDD
ncbi:MAG: hypothetical protein JXM69_18200 [Anaerolineae bacterium]|nr:hypothetical protein [Anaerolineae bacterium]